MRTIYKLFLGGLISASVLASLPVKAQDPSVVCLAKVIYYEARGEPLPGKLAVAKVTLNRTNSGKFPSTVCGVVYQRGQYSWTRGKPSRITDSRAWQGSLNIASNAVATGLKELDGFKAMYFHAKYVAPKWKYKRVAIIGNHAFYA